MPLFFVGLRFLQFGPDVGALFRPFSGTQTAYFSSRGPTADGRTDPDLVANGFASFGQGFDLGNILPAGLSAGALAADLSLYYSTNGGGTEQAATFVVPEPASMGLSGIGAAALLMRRRRRARQTRGS